MLNIVVPMAGLGSRFSKAGFDLPKPLILAQGKPMIQVVIENLTPSEPHRFIFICQNEHIQKYGLDQKLKSFAPGSEVVGIDGVTEGAACTVLKTKNLINNQDALMIANCDQYVAIDIDDYMNAMKKNNYDGFIMTMKADHPKWSYIQFDAQKKITGVVEKKVVSDEATVGIYNYRKGSDFVSAAEDMIAKNDRVNNEFYVAPVYNYLLKTGYKIGFYNIGSDRKGMYGLGVPEDLEFFNSLPQVP